MTNVSRWFNPDLKFFYGYPYGTVPYATVAPRRNKEGDYEDTRKLYRTPGETDWNRRAIQLPLFSKSIDNWTGKFEIGQVTFTLYDGDGSVYSTLYSGGSTYPFGTQVGIWGKITDNPVNWAPIFVGNITGVKRSKALTEITVEDNVRNLYNSQFVPDYIPISTTINGTLYGTVLDVIGTNVYFNDMGQKYLVKRVTKGDSKTDWTSAVFGAITGAGFGLITGNPIGAIFGLVSGFLGGIPTGAKVKDKVSYYWHVDDFDLIPEDLVFGGQPFKFYGGLVPGYANGVNSPLFELPTYRIDGGTFQDGIYGTLYVDDIMNNVKRGDYMYVQSPLTYYGSPDEIIVNMLTGTNSTVRYNFPTDFAKNWATAALPLKHILAFSQVSDTEDDNVLPYIQSLCEEFGFSFFVNEENKFAIKTIRELNLNDPQIIATLTEGFNVLGDGFSVENDIHNSYTDIVLNYNMSMGYGDYQQKLQATTSSGSYFGGQKRVLTIDSKWIHDAITGAFCVKRLARRYSTAVQRAECDSPLYALPVSLGEMVKTTGWAVGTNHSYEVVSYEKDVQGGVAHITFEDAEVIYQNRSFFYLGTGGTCSSGQTSGFATVLAATTGMGSFSDYGQIREYISDSQVELRTYFGGVDGYNIPIQVVGIGTYIRIGSYGDEVLQVKANNSFSTMISGIQYTCVEYKCTRSAFNTKPNRYFVYGNGQYICPLSTVYATCFNIDPAKGQYFKWF